MRTTLALDDDVIARATERARVLRLSLGKVVSDLARRGLEAAPPLKQVEGLSIFDPPKGSPRITLQQVKEALHDFP